MNALMSATTRLARCRPAYGSAGRRMQSFSPAATAASLIFLLPLLAGPALAAPSRPGQPTGAAVQVERTQIREKGAAADWFYIDDAGTTTAVSVVVSEQSTQPGSTGEVPTPVLAVSIFRVDAGGYVIFSGQGWVYSFGLTVSADLTKAHVAVDVLTQDESSGEAISVPVDVTWNGTGPVERISDQSIDRGTGLIHIQNFTGSLRHATATGTVLIRGENYTPVPSVTGQIMKSRSGDITVTRQANGSR